MLIVVCISLLVDRNDGAVKKLSGQLHLVSQKNNKTFFLSMTEGPGIVKLEGIIQSKVNDRGIRYRQT